MLVFPNCKINLGLSITGKRSDGFHNLETIFYPLAVRDALEIISDSKSTSLKIGESLGNAVLSTSGLFIDGSVDNNLCIKAYYLLQKDFPALPSIKLHLHKVIPMGAGLGGGSADGAFMLKLLNDYFELGLSVDRLIGYAKQLGSDCPFFIINEACFATGRGEIMEPILFNLSAYSFVLVNPGISVNTGWAFSQLNLSQKILFKQTEKFNNLARIYVGAWKDFLKNDFEEPVFAKFPEIKLIKEILYKKGALFASMTGSGSTVYGIFKKEMVPEFSFPKNYWVTRVKA